MTCFLAFSLDSLILWYLTFEKKLYATLVVNNIKIGIISELFFYASLIKDVIDGEIECDFEGKNDLIKVNAFFLVPRLHPLITDKVIHLLNLPSSKISYGKLLFEINEVEFV